VIYLTFLIEHKKYYLIFIIMGCIKPNKKLQNSDGLANFVSFLFEFDKIRIPKLGLFQILLSDLRPGLDSDLMASNIISKFEKIGIPSGALNGGASNVMEEYTKVITDEIVDSIQSDMRIDIAVDTGMLIQSNGANAGGPVVSAGQNILPHGGNAVAT
tara:strand:+ start:461 stop:934 length:474 start_codon:yes stop_codon:yes gene_type:complete